MQIVYSNSRNRDFLRLCRQTLARLRAEGQNPTIHQLIDIVLSKPAPAYYVDYYNACHVLIKALKEGDIPTGAYKSSDCWKDMYRDLLQLLKLHPTHPLRRLILNLCAGEAGNPRFYISRRSALAILKPHLKTTYTL